MDAVGSMGDFLKKIKTIGTFGMDDAPLQLASAR
jgi:hypothetical protein